MKHGYAIIRLDKLTNTDSPMMLEVMKHITVTKVVATPEEAISEVNKLNTKENTFYFFQITQIESDRLGYGFE